MFYVNILAASNQTVEHPQAAEHITQPKYD